MTGMSTSSTSRSGSSARNISIACEPSLASMTAWPMARSWSPSAAREVRESSAIRMRMAGSAPAPLLDPAEPLDRVEAVGLRDDADDLVALGDGQAREVLLGQDLRRLADGGLRRHREQRPAGDVLDLRRGRVAVRVHDLRDDVAPGHDAPLALLVRLDHDAADVVLRHLVHRAL